jgi:hypothetical protein
MDSISSGRLLKDTLGFWTGKRCFQALLREDPGSSDGYLHPPAMFSLGADRGTVSYARQPPYCRRCIAYGHTLASCSTRRCRYCGSSEHEARDCAEPGHTRLQLRGERERGMEEDEEERSRKKEMEGMNRRSRREEEKKRRNLEQKERRTGWKQK